MFTSIVVALDLEWEGDRALPIARSLSRLGDIGVTLLTVRSPATSEEDDAFGLRQRATSNGWAADSYVIVHDNDTAGAIVDYVESRPGALLVMSTRAKSPLKGHFLGSVSEAVLNHIQNPVLLIGPHVPATTDMTSTTPIACVDSTDVAAASFLAITSWANTFHSETPWVVEVLPPLPRNSFLGVAESAHVRDLSHRLAAAGFETSFEVLHGGDVTERLEDFASHIDNPVLVATSTNWTDDRTHWHSTTRRLLQRSTRPVLVIAAPGARPTDVPPGPIDVWAHVVPATVSTSGR